MLTLLYIFELVISAVDARDFFQEKLNALSVRK